MFFKGLVDGDMVFLQWIWTWFFLDVGRLVFQCYWICWSFKDCGSGAQRNGF